MVTLVAASSCIGFAPAPVARAAGPVGDSQGPFVYSFTGAPTYVSVPDNAQTVTFLATGGSGGDAVIGGTGGLGGVTGGTFYVTPGDQLELIVGGAGAASGAGGWGGDFSGGGSGAALWLDGDQLVHAGGGGGASVISISDVDRAQAMTVAGGGGGGGASGSYTGGGIERGGEGGAGGTNPADGAPGSSDPKDVGGAGGAAGRNIGIPGGTGADGVDTNPGANGPGGGGGGGALYGGLGGGVGPSSAYAAGGGGGGAGQNLFASSVYPASTTTASTAGDGSIELTWGSNVELALGGLPTTATASTTAVPYSVTATDGNGTVLPDPTGFVTMSSSEPTDTFTAAGVVMTVQGTRTITAAWTGSSAGSASSQVQVLGAAPAGIDLIVESGAATDGSTVILEAEAIDAFGNPAGDLTTVATYSSSVAADVFSTTDPNEVTVHGIGPRTLTASYPGLQSGTTTVQVSAAPDEDDPLPGIAVPVDDAPDAIAVSPDGTTALTASAREGTVTVVDVADARLVGFVEVGPEPADVAFSPSGATAYTINHGDGTVSVIDVATATVTGTLTIGSAASGLSQLGVRSTESGDLLYVSARGTSSAPVSQLYVVTVATGQVQPVALTIAEPIALAMTADSVVVASAQDGGVDVVDVSDLSITRLHRPDTSWTFMAGTSPDGHTVALPGRYATTWLDTRTMTFAGEVAPADGYITWAAAASPDGAWTFVLNQNQSDDPHAPPDTLMAVQNSDHTIANQIDIAQDPSVVATAGDSVLVATGPNPQGNYVLRILPQAAVTTPVDPGPFLAGTWSELRTALMSVHHATIELSADITGMPTGLFLPPGHVVTLDLHGHQLTITGADQNAAVNVPAAAQLTIADTVGGGTLTATGGTGAAAIGGTGAGGALGIDSGTVTINSGTVLATGGDNAAGIGGGITGAGGTVIIGSSATVTAAGGTGATAIGAGAQASARATPGTLATAGALTVPAQSRLTVPADTISTNSGVLTVDGTLTGAGTLANSGVVLAGANSVPGSGRGTDGTVLITGNNYPLTLQDTENNTSSTMVVLAPSVAAGQQTLPVPTPPSGSGLTFTGWMTADGTPVTDRTDLAALVAPVVGPASIPLTATFADLAAPALTLPADITAQAPDGIGVPVSFQVSATDSRDGDLPVTCDAAPGTAFPVATMTVTCTAIDRAGNMTRDSFRITVLAATPPTGTAHSTPAAPPVRPAAAPGATSRLDDGLPTVTLAQTGVAVGTMTAIAVAVVVLGGALLLVGRRRRQPDSS